MYISDLASITLSVTDIAYTQYRPIGIEVARADISRTKNDVRPGSGLGISPMHKTRTSDSIVVRTSPIIRYDNK